ncbi:PQQ-binding-like beta-propeller repeat protein [bacterium]
MKWLNRFIISLILLSCFHLFGSEKESEYNQNWPTWRGPLCTGEAPLGTPSLAFGEDQHVKWKIPIPGKGLSSPVIWGDNIFITTAVSIDKPVNPEDLENQTEIPMWMKAQARSVDKIQQFKVMSISRKTGDILWQNVVREELPHEGTHKDGSWASNSCVTDGDCLITFFGSYGVYCFDLKGKKIWEKDLGDMQPSNSFGEGSSPALYKNSVVINWDHEGDSFIIVLDKKTGKTIWKKERQEGTSWSTPIIVEVNGKPQIVVSATSMSRGYDLTDGEVIWQIGGLTSNVIPSPVYLDGVVYLMSGFRGNMIQAVRLDQAKGELNNSKALVWTSEEKITPYVPSPLLFQGKLYFLHGNDDKLSCADAKSGEIHYSRESLEGMKGVYAAPVAANNRIYVAGRNGVVAVIKPGPVFEVLATNTLNDSFDASPAIVGNDLILRGIENLYCISEL